MSSGVPLIVSREPVPRINLGAAKGHVPTVAVVYLAVDGQLHLGSTARPPGLFNPRYQTRYEVDISRHQRMVELRSTPPMAKGGIYGFETTLSVVFRVTDPVQVVRWNVDDALPVVYNYLSFQCQQITARFRIEDAEEAQAAINTWFLGPHALRDGITIDECWARLKPDAAAQRFLNDQEEARRENVVKAARHDVNYEDARRTNHLDLVKQSGVLRQRQLEHDALADRPVNVRELILIHLERFPQDTDRALQLLADFEQGRLEREDAREEQWRKMFQFLVSNKLVQPADIGRFRDEAMQRMQGAPAVPSISADETSWDAPLPPLTQAPHNTPSALPPEPRVVGAVPTVIPIYLVIDQSVVVGSGAIRLQAGIQSLYDTLADLPQVADVLRLSVVSFAEEAAVLLPPQVVRSGVRLAPFVTAGAARYATAFQQLLDCIPRDTEALKAENGAVGRPQVVFLSGGHPSDGEAWVALHQQLVDRRQQYAPDIVACGVGDASPQLIATIATRSEFAFVGQGVDTSTDLERFGAFVRRHVLRYGQSVLAGGGGPVIELPDGFRLADEPAQ